MKPVSPSLKHGWPRVREVEPGVYRISGRYLHVLRFHLLRLACALIVRVLILLILIVGVLPWWAGLHESMGTQEASPWILRQMVEVHYLLHKPFVEWYPDVGHAIGYGRHSRFDWPYLIAMVPAIRFRSGLSLLLAWGLSVPLWLLVSKRIKLTISPKTVLIHRLLRDKLLPRVMGPEGSVAFRTVTTTQRSGLIPWVLRGLLPQPPAPRPGMAAIPQAPSPITVMAMYGLEPDPIAEPLRNRQAERLIARCHAVMARGRHL